MANLETVETTEKPILTMNTNVFKTISFVAEEQRIAFRKENIYIDYDIYRRKNHLLLNIHISGNKKYQYSEAYFKIDKETGIAEYVLPRSNYKRKFALLHSLIELEEHLAILYNSLTVQK